MENVIESVKNMPMQKKGVLLAIIALSIAGIVLLFSWMQRVDYQVLYGNLAESDAGSIVQKLKEMKVPYRIEAGSVLVPSERVYDLRLQLAAQGLPHGGGIGFELFDKTGLSTTDFVQRLNYRRALQGELARTINSFAEVEQCRVHLAIPEKTLFFKESDRATASVLVKLRGGRTLAQSQVQGIVHLVSSSVEGLNPKDVTVIDSRGEMLTSPTDDIAGLSSSQLEYQRGFEKDIESRVIGILEPLAGKNRVRARVTASLDFTKIEKTEERFDPDGQVVRSEQKSLEKNTAGGTGGVPGVASNLPGKTGAQTAPSQSQSQSQRQQETINYEISRVTSRVINAPGEVKRLSVAVIVDGSYAAEQGSAEKKYVPRSEEDLKRYQDLVRNAIGYTADRGDEVQVVNMQFEGIPHEEFASHEREYLPLILMAARYVVPLVAVLFFIFMVLKPLLKTLSSRPEAGQSPQLALPRTVAEIEQAMDQKALPKNQEVIEWARKNPEQAAGLVKGWIEER